MSGINDLNTNYAEEYKAFGEKVLSENEKTLKKVGITPPPLFSKKDDDDDKKMMGLIVEKTTTEEQDNDTANNDEKNTDSVKKSSIPKNNTLSNVKSTSGMLNTVYKNSIKKGNFQAEGTDQELVSDVDDFSEDLEESDGKDDNDDFAEFMSDDYENGFHLNGSGYAYHEKSKNSSTQSFSAEVSGSYKSKNGKFTLSYGSSFEYSINKTTFNYSEEEQKATEELDNIDNANAAALDNADNTQTNTVPANQTKIKTETEQQKNQSGNANIMAKYRDNTFTYAGGFEANIFNNNTEEYYIKGGVMHNSSGIAATIIRKIEVSRFEDGEKYVDNKMGVKLHLLKPKAAEKQDKPELEIPTPEKSTELINLVQDNAQEVSEIAGPKGLGFSVNLKLSTAQDANEYGADVAYTFLASKKQIKIIRFTLRRI